MKYVILFIIGALLFAPLSAIFTPVGALIVLFILGALLG